MSINSQKSTRKSQEGIALLVLVIVIALTISAYYFSSISIVDIKVNNIEQTRIALKQAKTALINYAITHVDDNGGGVPGEYGYLPCPDSNGAFGVEGNQDTGGNCGGIYKNKLGYLPWRSLDLPAIKDGSGNCLWYAVSGNYKGEMSSGLINEDTHGFFQVVNTNGDILDDRLAAVVFAPGPPLSGQTRNHNNNTHCGGDYGNEAAYLEGNGVTNNSNVPDVVDSVDRFIHATLTSHNEALPYNDHFLTISREEIWQAIMQRSDLLNSLTDITEALTMCLVNYANNNANKRFPWPAPTDLNGNDYRMMVSYEDEQGAPQNYAGRFPFYLNESNVAIGQPAGNIIDMGFCDGLVVTSGVTVNLGTAGSEHRILLNNWKDHFFYAVSKDFALPDDVWKGCGDCVSVAGALYSAIVFFSGSPYDQVSPSIAAPPYIGPTQARNNADKTTISNYLENGNDALFTDTAGTAAYSATDPDPAISNDIMFCTESTGLAADPITLIAC